MTRFDEDENFLPRSVHWTIHSIAAVAEAELCDDDDGDDELS